MLSSRSNIKSHLFSLFSLCENYQILLLLGLETIPSSYVSLLPLKRCQFAEFVVAMSLATFQVLILCPWCRHHR